MRVITCSITESCFEFSSHFAHSNTYSCTPTPTPTHTLSHTHKPNQTLRFISPETVVLFPSTTFNLSIRLFFNHSLLPAVILCVGACAAVAGTAAAIVLHIFHCNSSSETKTFAQMHFWIKWKKSRSELCFKLHFFHGKLQVVTFTQIILRNIYQSARYPWP